MTSLLSLDESDLTNHIMRWGSDGYPIQKVGRKWEWKYRNLSCGKLYNTKREAIESFEAYLSILHDRKAGRI